MLVYIFPGVVQCATILQTNTAQIRKALNNRYAYGNASEKKNPVRCKVIIILMEIIVMLLLTEVLSKSI